LPVETEREDGTGIPYSYLRGKVMVQYLHEVEGMSYDQILKDSRSEQQVESALREWYQQAL